MAFTILVNSSTANANEVNANFYAVAQGSRLPMSGVSLAVGSTNTYDLGTSTAYWQNLYANNVNVNSITTANKSLWTLVSEVSSVATTTSIEFTGLNGDNDIEYKLIMYLEISIAAGALTPQLVFNGDSAANYGRQYISANSTSVVSLRQTEITAGMWLNGPYTVPVGRGFSMYNIYAKTGAPKMILGQAMTDVSVTTIYYLQNQAGVWNNVASTLTSIKIIFNAGTVYFSTSSHIMLWKRG